MRRSLSALLSLAMIAELALPSAIASYALPQSELPPADLMNTTLLTPEQAGTDVAPLTFDDDLYGGFIKNRATGDALALKCVERTGADCTGFHFYFIPASAASPADYVNLNPNVVFHADDLKNLESTAKKKIGFRVNPQGFVAPVFGATMVVWVLDQQNQQGGSARLPIWGLYVIAVPLDIVTFIPILVVSAAIFGVKYAVIWVEGRNVKNAMKALGKAGKIKKLGNKNFELLKSLIQQYNY